MKIQTVVNPRIIFFCTSILAFRAASTLDQTGLLKRYLFPSLGSDVI